MYRDLFSPQSVQDLLIALPTLPFALWETFYVTVLSTALSLVIGLPLGVLLVVGEKNGVLPLPRWLRVAGGGHGARTRGQGFPDQCLQVIVNRVINHGNTSQLSNVSARIHSSTRR